MHRTRNISLWCVLINGLPSGIYVRVYGVDNAPIAIKTMDARKSGAPQRTAFITPPLLLALLLLLLRCWGWRRLARSCTTRLSLRELDYQGTVRFALFCAFWR